MIEKNDPELVGLRNGRSKNKNDGSGSRGVEVAVEGDLGWCLEVRCKLVMFQ